MSAPITIRSILLASIPLGPSSTLATGISPSTGIVNLTPYMDFSWAKELTFILTVTAANGSPTGGSLTASFQLGNPHTGDGSNGTRTGYQYSDPAYVVLDSSQITNLIAESEDWPNPICNYDSSFPITIQRTLKNFGAMVNLQLDTSTLTGGTNPTFTISGVLIQKG